MEVVPTIKPPLYPSCRKIACQQGFSTDTLVFCMQGIFLYKGTIGQGSSQLEFEVAWLIVVGKPIIDIITKGLQEGLVVNLGDLCLTWNKMCR